MKCHIDVLSAGSVDGADDGSRVSVPGDGPGVRLLRVHEVRHSVDLRAHHCYDVGSHAVAAIRQHTSERSSRAHAAGHFLRRH